MNAHRPRNQKWRANPSPALGSQPSALSSRQRGFTLVELMIVITVIALLVGLLGVVIANYLTQAREAATVATIKKIHALLEQRTEAFDRAMDRTEDLKPADYRTLVTQKRTQLRNQGVVSVTPEQLRILVRKEFKQREFPQVSGTPPTTQKQKEAESSEQLYIMLTKARIGGAAPVDAGEFLAGELGDTDGDGRMEFLDGWGQPLRFYLWPTRLFKSNGTTHVHSTDGPNVTLLIQGFSDDLVDTDPDDPLGLLKNLTYANFESDFHTLSTYHLPLIVSVGADGEQGLLEPVDLPNRGTHARPGYYTGANNTNPVFFDASNPTADADNDGEPDNEAIINHLTDNITNRNQRVGD